MWKRGISEEGFERIAKKAQDYSGNRIEYYVDIMESAAFKAYEEASGVGSWDEIGIEDLAPFRSALRKLVRKIDNSLAASSTTSDETEDEDKYNQSLDL